MTAELVDPATGEVITETVVRASIAVARSHGEKFFEQIVWQVEHEAWIVLGYLDWDAMRDAEYRDLGVVAPRADRPELVTRLRARGLTQRQIGSTLGVSQQQVGRDLNTQMRNEARESEPITNSRGQVRPATYAARPEPQRHLHPVPEPAPLPAPAARRSGYVMSDERIESNRLLDRICMLAGPPPQSVDRHRGHAAAWARNIDRRVDTLPRLDAAIAYLTLLREELAR